MAVIVFGNSKGGVGKTTMAVNFAVEAAKDKKKVLLVDTDPQGSALSFRAERQVEDIHAVSLISDKLHQDIKGLKNSYDLVVIDAGGRDNFVFRSALAASDVLIMPILPSQIDVWAAEDTIKAFREITLITGLKGFIVLNQVLVGSRVSREALEAVEDFKNDLPLLKSHIHGRVAYKSSISYGQGVTEYEPTGKAAAEMQELYKEIMEVVGEN